MRRRAPKDVRARCESWTREEANDQRRQKPSELWECLNGSLGPRTHCNCRTGRAVLAGRHGSYRSPVAGLSGGFDRRVLWRRFAGSDGSSGTGDCGWPAWVPGDGQSTSKGQTSGIHVKCRAASGIHVKCRAVLRMRLWCRAFHAFMVSRIHLKCRAVSRIHLELHIYYRAVSRM